MKNDEESKKEWLAILWRESLRAMSLGWDLAVPIFGGALLGYFLDKLLGTGHIFTIGLIFFGIFVSYYNLAKFIQKMRSIDKQYLTNVKERDADKKGR